MNEASEGAALVAQWRENGSADSPAGPLFVGGEYAESDIVGEDAGAISCVTASECTGSRCSFCCI